ncbi:NADPH-dependent alcohol dehydrogenase [Flagelloscypha sp. PMI_526]|nr:NADPH-dependent alcohol dehydrogenase [Flagelloscypha sp. PMI_526]
MTDLKFKGYAIHDTSKWTDFQLINFQPKTFEKDDVDISIECCGICGSDVHTISGGWGKPQLPVIVGHEVVGHIVRVGSNVSEFKVGQRVGVGAQICSCGTCDLCESDNENYCPKPVYTYNSRYPNGDIAYGGYSTAIRANQRFVFPIPDALSSEQAAPMMCGGLTVFSPLVRNGAGPGKKIGVVGAGGLGHYAIQFAKALGAEVFVFSHSASKQEDAKAMANSSEGLFFNQLLSTLAFQGKLVMVASPEQPLSGIGASRLIATGCSIAGSSIGSKKEAIQMFRLAVEKGVKSWIKVAPMSQAGAAVQAVHEGKVRYRYVLKNDIGKEARL